MNTTVLETASVQDILMGILLGIAWSLLALGWMWLVCKIVERICK